MDLDDLLLNCRVVLEHGRSAAACRPVGPNAALQGLAIVRQQRRSSAARQPRAGSARSARAAPNAFYRRHALPLRSRIVFGVTVEYIIYNTSIVKSVGDQHNLFGPTVVQPCGEGLLTRRQRLPRLADGRAFAGPAGEGQAATNACWRRCWRWGLDSGLSRRAANPSLRRRLGACLGGALAAASAAFCFLRGSVGLHPLRGLLRRGPLKTRDALLRAPRRRRGAWAAPGDGAGAWSAGHSMAAPRSAIKDYVNRPQISKLQWFPLHDRPETIGGRGCKACVRHV